MTEPSKNNYEREQERQEQEINSDMEKLNDKTITPLDVVKDAASTMQREQTLEPYNSASDSKDDRNRENQSN